MIITLNHKIFKVAAARFLDAYEEETNKMKEKCSCSDNQLSNYTKTIMIIRCILSNNTLDCVLGIIPQYSLRFR